MTLVLTLTRNIKQYLTKREDLALAVVLVDANVDPQEKDAQLLDFLEECKVPRRGEQLATAHDCHRPYIHALAPGQVKTTVVATKVDKLKANEARTVNSVCVRARACRTAADSGKPPRPCARRWSPR